ncbi:GNAT family N-acetyltransferase [Aldersonia kunmingensis]|uniref:GNAT family N-acetyltransferase n=1 Tax=Aldersonia kunmingensis TaxID=408066 RepID=UPI000831F940|nr:GNAT family N-acetyltransferase [Aldersonia kunmingensis]
MRTAGTTALCDVATFRVYLPSSRFHAAHQRAPLADKIIEGWGTKAGGLLDNDRADETIFRELQTDDAEAVLALLTSMTRTDYFHRFFTADPIDMRSTVDFIVHSDDGSGAIGAFDRGRLIGVANYSALESTRMAEIALVVDHHHQHHGIGTELLDRLAQLATTHGIEEFIAEVLAENSSALQLVFDTKWPVSAHRSGEVVRFGINLVNRTNPRRSV